MLDMLKLKVMTFFQFFLSHLLIIAGLVLLTIGLLQGDMNLNISGIWVTMAGICFVFIFCFRKVIKK